MAMVSETDGRFSRVCTLLIGVIPQYTDIPEAIWYPNVVIKSLSCNLDICLNYHANAYFQSRIFVRVISLTDSDRGHTMLF